MLGLSPVKRSTFVIDRDRTVCAVISSEISMNSHADRALEAVKGL
jgi:peroxiredoxin Q/BCP